MANGCYFIMKVLGTTWSLGEFQKRLNDEDNPLTERVYECSVFDKRKLNDEKFVWAFGGFCAWSALSAMVTCDYNLPGISKELGLIIEIYSQNPDLGFEEHYFIDLGEITIAQSVDFFCYYTEELTDDEIEEKKSNAIQKGLSIDEEEKTLTIGGFDWKFTLDDLK